MKNPFTSLALVLAVAAPAAFIIELAGFPLPAMVDSAHLFAAFMLTFLLKIIASDYARAHQSLLANHAVILARPTDNAAKDSLRLAA